MTGDVGSFPGYRIPYKAIKIILNWKNKIFPQKFVLFVKDHLSGEKNGD